jgi:WS/DGAT/MGAT family acyltransferase
MREDAVSDERHPLSGADAAWLHMDRPTNLMVINAILLFEQPLQWERLAEVVRTRLVERYPRYRQRVREGRIALGGPHWEPDPSFELRRHLHRRGLATPGDEAALRDLAGDLASMPLDRDKPLWDMYLIDGPGAGSAVIVRMHHCIADGIALAQVMLSLTDAAPGGWTQADAPQKRTPSRAGRSLLDALTAPGRLAVGATREGIGLLAHPGRTRPLAEALAAGTRALAKLLLIPSEGPTMLRGRPGPTRRVAWSRPLALARVKAVAHAQGATVNDVLLACVSGALRGYLADRGDAPHEVRAMIPVNLRPPGPVPRELGNRFGLVYLTLPVDRASRRERLEELKRRMDEIKRTPEGPVSYAVLEAVGLTPQAVERRIVDIFTAKATAVMTNVPGPRETVYLAGTPLRAVQVWAPTAGSVAMSVSIFSYRGEVTIGLLVHPDLVPDPESILGRLPRELTAMTHLAPPQRDRAA